MTTNIPNQLGNFGTKTHFAIAEIVTEGNPVDCQFCQRDPLTDDFQLTPVLIE
jgi:hypothetical protein